MEQNKKSVTPDRAVKILAKHNVKVTSEQAEKILEFMNKLAQIAVDVYVDNPCKSDINDIEHPIK